MVYPKLVKFAKTPIRVIVESEETNEFGERQIILDKTFLCNYQDSAHVKYSKDKQSPEVTGTAYIDGDILETLEIVTTDFGTTKAGLLTLINSRVDAQGVISYAEREARSDVVISGHVVIFGRRREIVRGTKARNPDGSVNYTKIEVS